MKPQSSNNPKITFIVLFLSLFTFSFYSCHADKDFTNSESGYNAFYTKYSGEKNVTTFSLSAGLLNLFLDENDKDIKEVLNTIDQMSLLVHENGQTSKGVRDELFSSLPASDYNDLMIIRDGKETVTFKVRESNSIVNELIMVAESKNSDELVVISVDGAIPLDKVKDFAKKINVDKIKGSSK